MHDPLGSGTILGYCTNVHAGESFGEMRANLERFALPVKRRVCADRPMGVGLWFSNRALREVGDGGRAADLRGWLEGRGLLAYTLNGFPFGDFHEAVVKARVYEPHWADDARLEHTLGLAKLLAELLPDGAGEGSISTLPIGWPASFCGTAEGFETQAERAADRLMRLVHGLARLELDTGKHIHVCLEPEPGCVLETAAGAVGFFERYLLGGPDDESVRSYLRVCHDVCHSAVMFEPQADAVETYRDAGIGIGKVQLSSALRVDFDASDTAAREEARRKLASFDEPRYLHQTSVRLDDGRVNSYVDLGDALADPAWEDRIHGEWRVHFHVPVFAEAMGPLSTTRHEIGELLGSLGEGEVQHFEAETYAWDVLPKAEQADDLSAGIAEELGWLLQEFGR
ncbi:MAG: metabolite traffic protein EboE [Planctomycetota bacterium]